MEIKIKENIVNTIPNIHVYSFMDKYGRMFLLQDAVRAHLSSLEEQLLVRAAGVTKPSLSVAEKRKPLSMFPLAIQLVYHLSVVLTGRAQARSIKGRKSSPSASQRMSSNRSDLSIKRRRSKA